LISEQQDSSATTTATATAFTASIDKRLSRYSDCFFMNGSPVSPGFTSVPLRLLNASICALVTAADSGSTSLPGLFLRHYSKEHSGSVAYLGQIPLNVKIEPFG
jgi:hypothetical protein